MVGHQWGDGSRVINTCLDFVPQNFTQVAMALLPHVQPPQGLPISCHHSGDSPLHPWISINLGKTKPPLPPVGVRGKPWSIQSVSGCGEGGGENTHRNPPTPYSPPPLIMDQS